MKNYTFVGLSIFLFAVIVLKEYSNERKVEALKEELRRCSGQYRTNLSREEMIQLLQPVAVGSIALYTPGDTSVMPYLIKADKIECEVVRR
jgi:hypothetical protein